jgi:hypothetical protein
MGSTIWFIRETSLEPFDNYDHSAVYNYQRQLDRLCERLAVRKLTDFFDWSDVASNMEEFVAENGEFSVSEHWYEAQEIMPSLESLLNYLKANPNLADAENWGKQTKALGEELEDLISKAKAAGFKGVRFNLSVVM